MTINSSGNCSFYFASPSLDPIAGQRSITTARPASRASTAAGSLITPNCIHIVFAPMAPPPAQHPVPLLNYGRHPPYPPSPAHPPASHTLAVPVTFSRQPWGNRNNVIALIEQIFHHAIAGAVGFIACPYQSNRAGGCQNASNIGLFHHLPPCCFAKCTTNLTLQPFIPYRRMRAKLEIMSIC